MHKGRSFENSGSPLWTIDLIWKNATQTKAEFTCAYAVMDKTGSWTEEGERGDLAAPSHREIGGNLAGGQCIHTKAVICNGQKNMDDFKDKMNSVTETVNLACSKVFPDHWCVFAFSSLLHENDVLQKVNFDSDVPCVVQWALLLYSATWEDDTELVIEECMLETYRWTT